MMYSNAVGKPAHLSELPYFYLFAGMSALLTTIYISGWVWVLPHYLLFAIACLHMGLLVHRRRNKPKP